MTVSDHKECFGTIFPQRIQPGHNDAKVFSVQIDLPAGMMRRTEVFDTDVAQWDDCQQCPEFDSCYKLCMARIAFESFVAEK